jgi:Fe-Mn family superoxide dismutase
MDPDLAPSALMALLEGPEAPLILDVRRPPAVAAEPAVIPGAVWRDPEAVDAWAGALPATRPVVVYCVHGHEVSHAVRDALRRQGTVVALLVGGLEGWKAAGGPVAAMAHGERP